MGFEGITLSEISQTKRDKYLWSYLYVESKTNKPKFVDIRNRLVARGRGWEEKWVMGVRRCNLPVVNNYWNVMYSTVTIVNNPVVWVWKLLRVDLKSSYDEKKMFNSMQWCLLTRLIGSDHFVIYKYWIIIVYTWN